MIDDNIELPSRRNRIKAADLKLPRDLKQVENRLLKKLKDWWKNKTTNNSNHHSMQELAYVSKHDPRPSSRKSSWASSWNQIARRKSKTKREEANPYLDPTVSMM